MSDWHFFGNIEEEFKQKIEGYEMEKMEGNEVSAYPLEFIQELK